MKSLVFAISLLLAAPAFADSASYSMSNASATGIGDQIPGSPYDELFVTGNSGVATMGFQAPTVDLAQLDFNVGVNEYVPTNTPVVGSVNFDLTIGGQTQTEALGYSWLSPGNGYTDYLSFTTPANMTFTTSQDIVSVQFSDVATLSGGGGPVIEELYAMMTITPNGSSNPFGGGSSFGGGSAVPEPASLTLLTAGLAALAARRARKSA